MEKTTTTPELHDDLLETRGTRYIEWIMGLPKGLQVVTTCGTMVVAFLLGMLAWGLLLEFIF